MVTNFFESVPRADAYLMRHIIHDWNDEQSLTILRNVRRVIKNDGRLLLVEGIMPSGNEPDFSKLLDLNMLLIPGGKERTEEEYRKLYEAAGFRLSAVIQTSSDVSVIEGRPVRVTPAASNWSRPPPSCHYRFARRLAPGRISTSSHESSPVAPSNPIATRRPAKPQVEPRPAPRGDSKRSCRSTVRRFASPPARFSSKKLTRILARSSAARPGRTSRASTHNCTDNSATWRPSTPMACKACAAAIDLIGERNDVARPRPAFVDSGLTQIIPAGRLVWASCSSKSPLAKGVTGSSEWSLRRSGLAGHGYKERRLAA